MNAEVLIIGSGIAGLTAALTVASEDPSADILLVTKGALHDGATERAQGGIAAAIGDADSPLAHAQDTLAAGAHLGDPTAIHTLCDAAPAAIGALIARGVEFDRSAGPHSPYALGLEGAHSAPRILHAGGDATGQVIEAALVAAVTRSEQIRVLDNTALIDLVRAQDRVIGASLLTRDGRRIEVSSAATLLATGGAGQLYAHTSTPGVTTGDGIAAAWRAGAAIADLEFTQFHPTGLATDDHAAGAFLISEAVRGAGAVLRDARGVRFMRDTDPRAELAPRDVVAREIARVAARDGQPVLLDATTIEADGDRAEYLRTRFPTIDRALRTAGIDWASQPVPVIPTAHYTMGGIVTDRDSRTTVPGLYAVGECARSGVHGANRLASNSLLEGAVFGDLAGRRISEDLASQPRPADQSAAGVLRHPPRRHTLGARVSRAKLQQVMWRDVGLLRTAQGLHRAETAMDQWCEPEVHTVADVEDRNLLQVARLTIAAALARPVSIGAHHRDDHHLQELAC